MRPHESIGANWIDTDVSIRVNPLTKKTDTSGEVRTHALNED
jgi:hypothetical protein